MASYTEMRCRDPQYATQSTVPHISVSADVPSTYMSTRSAGGGADPHKNTGAPDWEAYKPSIKALYLDRNVSLNITISEMRERYGFKATEKMYKSQFQKWGWYKYRCKVQQREVQNPKGKSCNRPRRAIPDRPSVVRELSIKRSPAHSGDGLPITQEMTKSVKQFLLRSAEHDPIWSQTSRFRLLYQNQRSVVREWHVALDALDFDNITGGELVRRAFLTMEKAIAAVNLSSFLDLCLFIPRSLFFSRHTALLRIYAQHLDDLAQQGSVGRELHRTTSLLRSIVEHTDCEIQQSLRSASKAWAETAVQARGQLDRSALLAAWDSIRLSENLQETELTEWISDWEALHSMSILTHGNQSISTAFLENDIANLLNPSRVYPENIPDILRHAVGEWKQKSNFLCTDGYGDAEDSDGFFQIP